MKSSLVIMLLAGSIGMTTSYAQEAFVELKIKNSLPDAVTIYVTDHMNGNKTDENNREVSPTGEGTSKAKVDSKGYIDVTFSLKAKATGTSDGYYCYHFTGSAKDKKDMSFDLSKDKVKAGRYC